MEKLKALFGDKALTWDEFDALLRDSRDVKLANLCEGGYVDKAKFREKERELEEAKANAYRESGAEELKCELEALQKRYEEDLSCARVSEAVTAALYGMRARNPRLLKNALDMSSIRMEDGAVVGLDEQVRGLMESDPYLFESDEREMYPRISSGTSHRQTDTDLSKLSDEAYYAVKLDKLINERKF